MSQILSQKILEEIRSEIEKKNLAYNGQSVVHSDEFVKYASSSMGISPETVKSGIRMLLEAHMILKIEISAENEYNNIDKVSGYVVADLTIVRNLTEVFREILVKIYAKEHNKQLGAAQIIKEIFPNMNSLKHSELGQVANKAIILNEYEGMLERNWKDYSKKTQETKLAHLAAEIGMEFIPTVEGVEIVELPVKKSNDEADESAAGEEGEKFQRAVDSEKYNEFSAKNQKYPLQRILKIYGSDFFFRSNLRKYEFKYLKKIIDDNQIDRKKDLEMLRDMLKKVKDNESRDSRLESYRNDISELEKAVVHAIYFSV
ncbi:MAG: hypothetical protein JW982_02225 [Spirochaetes bacterium]|nr:hypothetical protein [Spirochaetota bacterium]